MHVITFKALTNFWRINKEAEMPLRQWHKITAAASWHNLADVRTSFRHADIVGVCTVFNIKGNDYRLVVFISYEKQKIYVLKVMTHREYNKGKWKNDCNC
jgi:mRNA interferase HigB